MRKLFILLAVAALSACTQGQIQTACYVDGLAQPVIVAVGLVGADIIDQSEAAKEAADKDAKVHTAVQKACDRLGGTTATTLQ